MRASINRKFEKFVLAKWKQQIPGGRSSGKTPEDFDREQLDAGRKVEMEHTRDPKLATEIAMDHLAEDKDYYRKLKVMEAKKSEDSSLQGALERSLAQPVEFLDGWRELVPELGAVVWGEFQKAFGPTAGAGPAAGGGARSHKYLKRVPYNSPDGKRHYRYFYKESGMTRETEAGSDVKLGQGMVHVQAVTPEGHVTVQEEGQEARQIKSHEWHETLAKHYGEGYLKSAEKRARQVMNAVLRQVPRKLLQDLLGETDEARLEDLKKRVPEVYQRLDESFKRAGISIFRAKEILGDVLQRRGWEPDARAVVIGAVLTEQGVKAASGYRSTMRAAENLAGDGPVHAQHVQAALELWESPEPKIEEQATQEVGQLQALMKEAFQGGDRAKIAAVLAQALAFSSEALQQLSAAGIAYPGLLQDPVIKKVREALLQVPAVAPKEAPSSDGSATTVFLAGEGGQAKGMKAHYKLMEAEEAIASHDPSNGFKVNSKYPEGVQERAYHRDFGEQDKVRRNAKRLEPAFLVNTNPDAVNGPPLITHDGIVLGGNSRTMSMQLAYQEQPDRAEALKKYLGEHAHEVGLQAEDVQKFKNPILVRQLEPANWSKEELQSLVRKANESFTQAMDPRAMQVALARKLDDKAVEALSSAMNEEETLSAFLSSKRAEPFLKNLRRVGVIDERNANQFFSSKGDKLNEDGKTLITWILVGRMVPDGDLLNETRPKLMESVAQAVPSMIHAIGFGKGYDLSASLQTAIHAYNRIQDKIDNGILKPLDPGMSDKDVKVILDNYFSDMFGEKHPILSDDRAQELFKVFIRKAGPKQMAGVFREYADLASKNPEGQKQLLGENLSPAEVFKRSIALASKKESKVQKALSGVRFILKKAAGPFIGPRGGKWEDAEHKISWKDRADYHDREVQKIKRRLRERHGGVFSEYDGLGATTPNKLLIERVKHNVAAMAARNYQREPTKEEVDSAVKEATKKWAPHNRRLHGVEKSLTKAGGPYIGPKGGKWADVKHTQHWDPDAPKSEKKIYVIDATKKKEEAKPAEPEKKPEKKEELKGEEKGKTRQQMLLFSKPTAAKPKEEPKVQTIQEKAAELGVKAKAAGLPGSPGKDGELMKLVEKLSSKETQDALVAWMGAHEKTPAKSIEKPKEEPEKPKEAPAPEPKAEEPEKPKFTLVAPSEKAEVKDNMTAADEKIAQEVGEHVWGARKDLWVARTSADLQKLTPEEQSKISTKKNLLPKWETDTLLDDGWEPEAIVMRHAIESLVQNAPGNTLEARQAYMDGIDFLAKSLEECRTLEDIKGFLADWEHLLLRQRREATLSIDEAGKAVDDYFEHKLGKKPPKNYKERKELDDRFREARSNKYHAASVGDADWNKWLIKEQEIDKERREALDNQKFQIDDVVAWKLNLPKHDLTLRFEENGITTVYRADPEIAKGKDNPYALMAAALGERVVKGLVRKYQITRPKALMDAERRVRKMQELGSEEKEKELFEHLQQKQRKGGQRMKPFKWERNVPGEVDRKGGKPVTAADPKALASDFKFKNVQFGNWVNEQDAESHLKGAHGALFDLSDVLGISPEVISLGGRLSIAFGARGSGNALAHYETMGKIINLTKIKGCGSLAHEWGHALDNLLTVMGNPQGTAAHQFISGGVTAGVPQAVSDAMEGVMGAIHYKDPSVLQKRNRAQDMTQRWDSLSYKERQELRQLHKEIGAAEQSRYFQDASVFSKAPNSYWTRPHELFARAFESYVEDTLVEANRKSSYLVSGTRDPYETGRHSAASGEEHAQTFPQGEERKGINKAIQKLIGVLKQEKALEKALQALEAQERNCAMSRILSIDEYLAKAEQGLPKGEPGLTDSEKDGGELAGVGQASGATSGSAGSEIGAPVPKTKKLSEDDEEDEEQMKPGKKPLEASVGKSMAVPQHQRDLVAHENAQVVSQLRKGEEDIVVGMGQVLPEELAPEGEKTKFWTQGEKAMIVYSNALDIRTEKLLKGDAFYANGEPSVGMGNALMASHRRCSQCERMLLKSLSACPHCGFGAQLLAVQPMAFEGRSRIEKGIHPLQPARHEADLVLPQGTKVAR
jgi:ribosomal protein L37E